MTTFALPEWSIWDKLADNFETYPEARHCAFVIPVNCLGVMGAGLAKDFADRAPTYAADFKRSVAFYKDKGLGCHPGEVLPLDTGRGVILFAFTKDHYKDPSQLEWVQLCARNIAVVCRKRNPKLVKVPALGCGLGGLSWDDVRPVLVSEFEGLHSTQVVLYPPR